MCHNVVVCERHNEGSRPRCRLPLSVWISPSTGSKSTGVDANGHVVVRRRLWRSGVIRYCNMTNLEPKALRHECRDKAVHERGVSTIVNDNSWQYIVDIYSDFIIVITF